jgi:UDP-N-acetylglucosamine--N-acetylmuramyl-(pentapeptide) pyrophosphoryl-undecaprenol N-acetylglucosamine transferase
LELLDVRPIKGVGPAKAFASALIAGRETARAYWRVRRLRPDVVLSIGGYAAGPVALAATMSGVPLALLEPNSVPGLTTRLLAPAAREAYVAFEEARAQLRARAVRVFGVPIRSAFSPRPYRAGSTRRVLVMGGSQGAAALNERLPLALAELARGEPRLEVRHQTGAGRADAVRDAYLAGGLPSANVVPFLDDVAGALGWADLVVARAGAVTLAEVTAVGRAIVCVPFPHAADDHQARNAAALERKGAAVVLRQDQATPAALCDAVRGLLADAEARERMALASMTMGHPHAADDVALALLDLAGLQGLAADGPSRSEGTAPRSGIAVRVGTHAVEPEVR